VLVALAVFVRAGAVTIVRPISDYYVAGRLVPAMLNGMAIAVSFAAVLAYAVLAGSAGEGRAGIVLVLLAGAAGLLGGGMLLAPFLRKFGGYTLPDFLGERFGGTYIRPLAVLGVVLCAFPALALVLLALGALATRIFPIELDLAVLLAGAVLLLCALGGGMRAASLTQIAQYALLLLVSFIALAILLWLNGGGFGAASSAAFDKAWTRLSFDGLAAADPLNAFALAFCLAAGVASLPHLLARGLTTPTNEEARISYFWALGFVAALCLAAPVYGVLFASDALAGRAATALFGLAAIGAIAALLASGSGLLLAVANALSYDVYFKSLHPTAPTEQRLLVARAAVLLVAILAVSLAVTWPQEAIDMTAPAFSLAASALLPALALGIWWERATIEGALAGMLVGLGICLFYLLMPRYFPIAFYEMSSVLSNATPEQATSYASLRQAYYLADPSAKEAALAAWDEGARKIANWGGLNTAFAGLIAVPAGLLTAALVSAFTPAPSEDTQSFVAELRKPAS
jgi:cation/acetate symporter